MKEIVLILPCKTFICILMCRGTVHREKGSCLIDFKLVNKAVGHHDLTSVSELCLVKIFGLLKSL